VTFNVDAAIANCWEVLGVLWLIGLAFSKPAVRKQSAGSRLFYYVLSITGAFLIWGYLFPRNWLAARFAPHTQSVAFAGLALTITGCLFAIWARISLGTNWSGRATVKAGHELIVKGPYALVRHPIYTGILLGLAGTVLAIGQWRCILGFLLILIALGVKMGEEERLMTETFPQAYPEYRCRVKALIPGVF
jgi:protein-S-isoprenylcysteine O-methyltransferase Ste14